MTELYATFQRPPSRGDGCEYFFSIFFGISEIGKLSDANSVSPRQLLVSCRTETVGPISRVRVGRFFSHFTLSLVVCWISLSLSPSLPFFIFDASCRDSGLRKYSVSTFYGITAYRGPLHTRCLLLSHYRDGESE